MAEISHYLSRNTRKTSTVLSSPPKKAGELISSLAASSRALCAFT
jgi:hypothetical protein